tara:strand:+ start:173 stop:286 length:114 start_codon:yes stop_codon:yes gene_type:complete
MTKTTQTASGVPIFAMMVIKKKDFKVDIVLAMDVVVV